MNPKITLIMTSYNQLDLLKPALQSALAQTVRFPDILIIDDASTDSSVEWLNDMAEKHSNITLLVNDENLGRSATRNRAMSVAQGEYFGFLDGDDLLEPDAHECWLELLDGAQPDLVVFNTLVFDTRTGEEISMGSPTDYPKFEGLDVPEPHTDEEIALLLQYLPAHWTKLHRAAFVRDNNLFFKFPVYEDIWVHVCELTLAKSVRCTPRRLIRYRKHPNGILSTQSKLHAYALDVHSELDKFLTRTATHRPEMHKVFRAFAVRHLLRIALTHNRIPDDHLKEFASRILELPWLGKVELTEDYNDLLDQLRCIGAGMTTAGS